MRRNGLKLNPEKCIFGIRRGQLLGCMVSKWGIQANPQKIEALRRMQPPSSRGCTKHYGPSGRGTTTSLMVTCTERGCAPHCSSAY
jgi:hypothetical protein